MRLFIENNNHYLLNDNLPKNDTPPKKSLSQMQVSEIEDFSPRVRRIRFYGEFIHDIQWHPGQKVKLEVEQVRRSYTPSAINTQAGWMDIVFFLHGKGFFSRWASSVEKGAHVGVVGPVHSMPEISFDLEWAIFLGDETTIGLAQALIGTLPESVSIIGAIEVDSTDQTALRNAGLSLQVALRGEIHGASLREWVTTIDLPKGNGVVWLSGDAGSVRDIKSDLLVKGFKRSQIKAKSYWSVRGHQHRKRLQKDL